MIEVVFSVVERLLAIARAFVNWLSLDLWEFLLLLGTAAFLLVLKRLHRSADNNFRFEHFFADDVTGKGSFKKLAAFGCFLGHSWITLRMAAYRELTLEFAALYVLTWSGVYVIAPIAQAYAERIIGVKLTGEPDGSGKSGSQAGPAASP